MLADRALDPLVSAAMVKGTHWFDQHGGCWPTAACGRLIRDERWTLWMSKVTCPRCMAAVQLALDALAPAEPEPPAPSAETIAALASLRVERARVPL